MSLDLCLKQLHVVHKGFQRMQYIVRHFPVLQILDTQFEADTATCLVCVVM